MTNLIIQVSKYLIIVLMALYTLQCYTVFQKREEEEKDYLFLRQNMLMFFMHFVAFTVLYLEKAENTILIFYGAQAIYLAAVLVLFKNLYPLASRLLINNMTMLICIGFIMITRLNYDQSVKQFKIAVISTAVALLIPLLIRKLRFITKMYWAYTLLGIGLLALVAIAARSTNGAKLSFNFGSFSLQPSEFVKIIFVFAIAGLLSHAKDFRRIVIATGLAAVHVMILVLSKDLGSALIFFATYLVMLFVATRNPFYVLAGVLSGSGAAVAAYFLFYHIRVRVKAWRDPFADYQGGGYQICQSLFAISAGGWFGTGLCQGSPKAIPYVEQDFMFSAIAEELGGIFGICLILVCMSCFIMFINIAMQLTNRFYRLVAVGLGSTYAVQIFLTIGGGIKLIPMTGVTLPLVSYGGSSMLSTLIMFSIVEGLYMLQRDEQRQEALKNAPQGGGQYYEYSQQNIPDSNGYAGPHFENRGYENGYDQEYDYDQNYGYDQNQGYGREYGYDPEYGYNQNQGYDPEYGYNQNQGYGSEYGYNQKQGYDAGYGYNQNQDYRREYGYDRDQGYGQNYSYDQNRDYGQEYGYDQNPDYGYDQYQEYGYDQYPDYDRNNERDFGEKRKKGIFRRKHR